MHFLGVDGGGTKTNFMLIDQDCNCLGYSRQETTDYLRIGAKAFKDNINNGINECLKMANITLAELDFACLGIPCLDDEIIKDKDKVISIIGECFIDTKYSAINDAFVGWAGSLACEAGINLVAGTGSIVVGIDNNDKMARAGGWGSEINCDEGSAHWMAIELLREFTKQADYRKPRTQIYSLIKKEFKLDNDYSLLEIIYNDLGLERNKIAQLAKFLYIAATCGDIVAIDIYNRAGQELALLVEAIISQLDFNGKILLSYSGGVFNAGHLILDPLMNNLKEYNIQLVKPILTPVCGAALYARNKVYKITSENYISRLKQEDERIWR